MDELVQPQESDEVGVSHGESSQKASSVLPLFGVKHHQSDRNEGRDWWALSPFQGGGEHMRKKLGDKLALYNKLDIRLAKFYGLHPDKAAAILSDIYFYVDFFDSSTIEKHIKWKRVIDYLWITHGVKLSRFAVRRWYMKMKRWRN